MHLECHSRRISGPNYVTLLSSISRMENTLFLSLYQLPLSFGLNIVWNIPSSLLPILAFPELCHKRDTIPEKPLPFSPISGFLAFSFFISPQIYSQKEG